MKKNTKQKQKQNGHICEELGEWTGEFTTPSGVVTPRSCQAVRVTATESLLVKNPLKFV